ncbi:MAG: Gfo/Idh/MocA family oxidoreductase [Parvularculaceae bacterium]|nr:Gfo/Idh/MocA family oxidoreductase [Parvularculaceae bacterium]
MPKRQVAIVGAGFIAGAHLAVLKRRSDVSVAAVVDPALARAEAAAGPFAARAFADVEAMLRELRPDAAHVLTPPPLHLASAEPLLKAGVSVLLEKPMAETAADCARLETAARATGAALVVNHNFTHHPAYIAAKRLVAGGRFGRARRVQARYAAPLRQLAARQFGHWMFESPRNLLLEQVVHPLSQIDDMLGGVLDVEATPGPPARPADGVEVRTDWLLNLTCGYGLAQLEVALGASFPCWTLSILCDDGVVEADIFEGRVAARRPHPDIPPLDYARRNFNAGSDGVLAAAKGLGGFAMELARLGPASDGFSRSMTAAVAAFHEALRAGARPVPPVGGRLVALCGKAAARATYAPPRRTRLPAADESYDVAVLGGTGFIGAHLVSLLIEQGRRVAVMARSTSNLPTLFHHERVGVFRGSVGDREAVARAIANARKVVNLAHGGGGATRQAVEDAMVGGAVVAAEAARAAGAERCLFISSSAALYLGDKAATVTLDTAADPHPDERGDYARAKILAERAFAAIDGLAGVILRPAVVVGEGASPFHSALGAFENETHCVGWNDGRNPLPFVLARDVATAIANCLDADLATVRGKTLNLVGDVRWSARRYLEELALATGRPLKFHPSSEISLMAGDWTKWAVKRLAGRTGVSKPSPRDLRSRAMASSFDTSAEKRLLSWTPCADEAEFRRLAILPHVR